MNNDIKTGSYGTKYYYVNNVLHREDGPAIESSNGTKYWYLEDELLTKKEFNKAIKTKNASTCENKYVEVDGVKYKLVKI